MLKNTMLLTSALMVSLIVGSGAQAHTDEIGEGRRTPPPSPQREAAAPPNIKKQRDAAKKAGAPEAARVRNEMVVPGVARPLSPYNDGGNA